MFILALFNLALEFLAGSRATDITLDGEDAVLLGAAKMTLIVPTIKFTSTMSKSVYMGSLIWHLGMIVIPSKLTKRES